MARNTVMKLWTTVVTAFLALCTALGFITTTASAAVPRTGATCNSENGSQDTAPAMPVPHWSTARAGALPPTMKQRIHAEAHGMSPGCRHRPPADAPAGAVPTDARDDTASSPAEPATGHLPLQR